LKRLGGRGILLIFAGILVVGFGLYMTWRLFQSALNPLPIATAPPPVTEKVLVTSRGIPLGSVLGPNDLVLVDVPVGLVPLSRMNDLSQAVGKVTTVSLIAGEMVLPHHLVDPSNVIDRSLAFTLGDDQVLMAFPIVDLMSNLNILKKGDVVDILVTMANLQVGAEGAFPAQGEAQARTFTFDAMQRIVITAIVKDVVQQQEQPAATPQALLTPGAVTTPQPPPEPSRGQSRPVALMLALSPQDALVLKNLKDTGAIFDLVLRSPTSTELFDTTPVTSEYIIERYQLMIR
jgi:Flp pilus assembly protein CpaB